jgi:hypothetical protein
MGAGSALHARRSKGFRFAPMACTEENMGAWVRAGAVRVTPEQTAAVDAALALREAMIEAQAAAKPGGRKKAWRSGTFKL